MDQRELFEGVCALLEKTGLVIPAPGAPGLRVRLGREGVAVGWRPVSRQAGAVAPLSLTAAPGRRTDRDPQGLGKTVTSAVSMILERAGYLVVSHDGDLLVTGRLAPADELRLSGQWATAERCSAPGSGVGGAEAEPACTSAHPGPGGC